VPYNIPLFHVRGKDPLPVSSPKRYFKPRSVRLPYGTILWKYPNTAQAPIVGIFFLYPRVDLPAPIPDGYIYPLFLAGYFFSLLTTDRLLLRGSERNENWFPFPFSATETSFRFHFPCGNHNHRTFTRGKWKREPVSVSIFHNGNQFPFPFSPWKPYLIDFVFNLWRSTTFACI